MGEEFSSRGARAGYDVKRLSADRIAYYFPGDRKKNRPAVTDVSFTAAQGEILGIMGSSGSGKSTLLKLAAELLRPTVGTITYHGGKPRIGFLFQDDVILPWRTVGGNLQYPLEGFASAEIRRIRAQEICRAIHLPPAIYWERFPKELSGGERRRLSVGMAIAREVEILLLDEPTSQLDEKNKWIFQDLIQEIWLTNKPTVIVVTHNLDEAVVLSDRLLVLDNGRLVSSFDVRLARPRRPGVRSDPEFVRIRKTVADELSRVWNMASPQ